MGIEAELVERGIDAWLEAEDEDEVLSVLLDWLDGAQLTERADEADRRLEAADDLVDMLGDEVSSVHRFHARAVLSLLPGHERRDVAVAVASLYEHLDAEQDAEEVVYTIAALLDADEDLLEEGEEWAPRAEAGAAAAFARAADAFCSRRWIDSDEAGKEAWAARNERYLPDYDEDDLGSLAAHASFLDRVERWDEAADVYGQIVERSELGAPEAQQLGIREAELRLSLGDDERSAEALARILPHVEANYLTAVLDEELSDGQSRLDDIAGALAITRARLGDWDGVLRAMDRANGLRGRYRAALRLDGEGQDLLALERELDFAARREASRAELLERYRHVRARLDPSRLASVSARDVAAVLEPGEAVVALRFHFAGSVAVAVAPGDEAGLLLEDFGARQWLELFASGEEFLTALVEPWAGVGPEPGLAEILAGVDDLLGDWLRELVAKHGVRRLTLGARSGICTDPAGGVEPVPSLRGSTSMSRPARPRPSGCAAALERRRATRSWSRTRRSTCRASAAACGPVAERLAGAGFAVTALAGTEASEDALLGAVGSCPLLHFAGHGRAGPAPAGVECIDTSPATRSASGSSAPRAGATWRWRTTTRGSSGSRTCRMRAGSSSDLARLRRHRPPARARAWHARRDLRSAGPRTPVRAALARPDARRGPRRVPARRARRVLLGLRPRRPRRGAGRPARRAPSSPGSMPRSPRAGRSTKASRRCGPTSSTRGSTGGLVDVAALVRRTGERLSAMGLEEARERLLDSLTAPATRSRRWSSRRTRIASRSRRSRRRRSGRRSADWPTHDHLRRMTLEDILGCTRPLDEPDAPVLRLEGDDDVAGLVARFGQDRTRARSSRRARRGRGHPAAHGSLRAAGHAPDGLGQRGAGGATRHVDTLAGARAALPGCMLESPVFAVTYDACLGRPTAGSTPGRRSRHERHRADRLRAPPGTLSRSSACCRGRYWRSSCSRSCGAVRPAMRPTWTVRSTKPASSTRWRRPAVPRALRARPGRATVPARARAGAGG